MKRTPQQQLKNALLNLRRERNGRMNPLKICAMKRTPQQQFEAGSEALRLADHWGFEGFQRSAFIGIIMANVSPIKAARIVRERMG